MHTDIPKMYFEPITIPKNTRALTLRISLMMGIALVLYGISVFFELKVGVDNLLRTDASLISLIFKLTNCLFALFLFVFAGILLSKTVSRLRFEDKNSQNHPDKPWLWNSAWVNTTIQCQSTSSLTSKIGFITGSFFSIYVLIILIFFDNSEINFSSIIAPLFFLFMMTCFFIGGCISFYKQIKRVQLHGDAYLELDHFPARLGQTLCGNVYGMPDIIKAGKIRCAVKCLGVNKTTKKKTKIEFYSAESFLLLEKLEENIKSVIPVEFDIPEKLPQSNWLDYERKVFWTLSVETIETEKPYKLEFDIPVFNLS